MNRKGATYGELIVGFFLTGVIGTWITFCWEQESRETQIAHLERTQTLERQHALIDSVTTSVATTNTAAEDVLSLVWWDHTSEDLEDTRERWEESSRMWRVESKVLSPKIEIFFKDSQAAILFDSITWKRTHLGNEITNILEDLRQHRDSVEPALRDSALSLSRDLTALLSRWSGVVREELSASSGDDRW